MKETKGIVRFWSLLVISTLVLQATGMLLPFSISTVSANPSSPNSSSSEGNHLFDVRAQAIPLVVAVGEIFEVQIDVIPLAGSPEIEAISPAAGQSWEPFELEAVQSRIVGGVGQIVVRLRVPDSPQFDDFNPTTIPVSVTVRTASGDVGGSASAFVVVQRFMKFFARSDDGFFSGFQDIRSLGENRPAGSWWVSCKWRDCPYATGGEDESTSLWLRDYLEIGTMVPDGTELQVPKGAVLWIYGLNPLLMLAHVPDAPADVAGSWADFFRQMRMSGRIPEARVELRLEGGGFLLRPYDADEPGRVGDPIDVSSFSPGVPVWRPASNPEDWSRDWRLLTRDPSETWNLGVIAVGTPGTSATLVARFVSTADGQELFRRELRLTVAPSYLEGLRLSAPFEHDLYIPPAFATPWQDPDNPYGVPTYPWISGQIDLTFSHFDDRGLAWFDAHYRKGPASDSRQRAEITVYMSGGESYYAAYQAAVQRVSELWESGLDASLWGSNPTPSEGGLINQVYKGPPEQYSNPPQSYDRTLTVVWCPDPAYAVASCPGGYRSQSFGTFRIAPVVFDTSTSGTVAEQADFRVPLALRDLGRGLLAYAAGEASGQYEYRVESTGHSLGYPFETVNSRCQTQASAGELTDLVDWFAVKWNETFSGGTLDWQLEVDGEESCSWSGGETSQTRVLLHSFDLPFTATASGAPSETELQVVASPPVLTLRDVMRNRSVEFTVTLRQGSEPVAGEAVTVTGPQAGVLALPEPSVTDGEGRLTFSWLPPEPDYFRDETLPMPFIFTVQAAGNTRQVEVDVVESTWTIRGRVVSRHAGAVPSDTDGDGLVPVAGAEVSVSPDFSSGPVVTTNADGWFDLPVNRPDTYTLYVRKNASDPPYTSTRQTGVRVEEESETTVLTEPLYLADLGVARQKERTYLPYLRDYLAPTELERLLRVEPPADAEAGAEAFLDWLRHVEETESWYEEALRRLNLAEFVGFEGAKAADEFASFAAREIWDGTLGAVTRLIKKNLENIKVVQLLKNKLKADIAKAQANPARLEELKKTLALIETAEKRIEELNRKLVRVSNYLYFQVASPAALSGKVPQQYAGIFRKSVKYVNDRLNELVLGQVEDILGKTKLGQMTEEAAAAALEPIQRAVDELVGQMQNDFTKFLAVGFRQEVGAALDQAVGWAQAGNFPQHRISYASARNLVRVAMMRQQELVNQVRGYIGQYETTKTFVDGVVNDWNSWAKGALVAVTAGTAAQVVAITDRVLGFIEAMEPVAQVAAGLAAAAPLSHDGALTRATVDGIRMAFSKTGRVRARVHSPVTLMAVDEAGRRTGADAQGRTYAEIPGAYYQPASGDEPETLYLPEDVSRYRILVFGTGSGDYTLEVGTEGADGTFSVTRSVYGTASAGSSAALDLELTAEGPVAGDTLAAPGDPEELVLIDSGGTPVGEELRLVSGEEAELRAVVRDGNGRPLYVDDVEWVVEGADGVLAVEGRGPAALLRAGQTGKTTLRATYGNRRAAVGVTVEPSLPAEVRLSAEPQVVAAGGSVRLIAEVTDGYNGRPGWEVVFSAPELPEEQRAIGQAVSDENGKALLEWTVPEGISGPLTVAAVVYRPDVGDVTGLVTLQVKPSAAEGQDSSFAGPVEIPGNTRSVGRVDVPAGAFAGAVYPVLVVNTLVESPQNPSPEESERLEKVVPPWPQDLHLVGPVVEVTAADLTSGRPVQPSQPLVLRLESTSPITNRTGVYTAVYANGSWTWKRLAEHARGTNWVEALVPHLSLFALLEAPPAGGGDTTPPGGGEGGGGGEEPAPAPGAPSGGPAPATPSAAPSATAEVNPASGGVIQAAGGRLQVEIPAQAVALPAGATLRVTVAEVPQAQAGELLSAARVPAGVTPVGRVFEFRAEQVSGGAVAGPVATFDKPVTVRIALQPEDLAGVGDPERLGLFRLNDDGTLTFVGGKLVDGRLVVRLQGFSRYVLAEVRVSFPDLAGHWAQRDVELMAAKYVVKGLPDGRFDPGGRVTRAQFAAMLVRAMGLQPARVPVRFRDVKDTDWYFSELMTAVSAGIIKGYDDGTFRPDDPVTREQVAAMLARALRAAGKAAPDAGQAEAALAGFGDAGEVSAWARADLALAVQEGIVKGQTATTLAPQAGATRAEAAVMIARFWRKV